MANITISERIYLDANGRVTVDPEQAARLWATPGMEVSEAEAAAVGWPVSSTGGGVPEEIAPKAVRGPKGTKVVEGPEGDK